MAPEMLLNPLVQSIPLSVDVPLSVEVSSPGRREIVKTPGTCGGTARIQGTRITIWGLEEDRRHGISDAEMLEMYPSVTADDLCSAWEYVSLHQSEIDEAIDSNNDD